MKKGNFELAFSLTQNSCILVLETCVPNLRTIYTQEQVAQIIWNIFYVHLRDRDFKENYHSMSFPYIIRPI